MATATIAIMTAIGASAATTATAATTVGAIGAALPTLSTAAGVLSAGGAIYSGYKANEAAGIEAKQLKQAGDDAKAEGQRRAMGARRQKNLVASRARAVAAASGAGPTGGSVDAIMEGIEQQGEYNATVAFFEGTSQRNKAYASAASRKASGKTALVSGVIRGGTNFYDKYARGY